MYILVKMVNNVNKADNMNEKDDELADCQRYKTFQQNVADAWNLEEEDEFADCVEFVKSPLVLQLEDRFLTMDMTVLQELSWQGIPPARRANIWRLLLGYVPMDLNHRKRMQKWKQEKYWNLADQYYGTRYSQVHQRMYQQIQLDIPRTEPKILSRQPMIQEMLKRILYLWSFHHPVPGYVQGMNDCVILFLVVFMQELFGEDSNVEDYCIHTLPEDDRKNIEADTFWCLTKLLSGILDYYIPDQPGIQDRVHRLEVLIQRVDIELHQHFRKTQIEYIHFAFRWMNNLLVRELPLKCSIRLWDTYLSLINTFADFHVYTCAAFLLQWREPLLQLGDFGSIMMLILNPPTQSWSDRNITEMLDKAYQLQSQFPRLLPGNFRPSDQEIPQIDPSQRRKRQRLRHVMDWFFSRAKMVLPGKFAD